MRVGAREAGTVAGLAALVAAAGGTIFALRSHPELLQQAREMAGRTRDRASIIAAQTVEAGRRARTTLAPVAAASRDVAAHVIREAGDEIRKTLPEAGSIVARHAAGAATRRGAHELGQLIEDYLSNGGPKA
ncbi:MAG: hypothetical protein KGJ07_03165 [Patescibacteria group bacterium]|nr:hypothetical protein [Patescibacteria group bacterium]MDE2588150.1 hypothetical protein [Patescibacteria group bacterium]